MHAVQEVAEFCVGCIHDFALSIEKCICMDLDGFIRVDVLKEPFELNRFRQVIILLGNAADEESFRLISGLDFYLGKENCYRDHLQFLVLRKYTTQMLIFCAIYYLEFSPENEKRGLAPLKNQRNQP